MVALHGFNANEVEPNDLFDPIPSGEYLCVITSSEEKQTKSRNGSYLELEFEVIEGPCKGRKLWDRLNLDNPNETAVKIARATLSAICRAVNVATPNDSYELHDLPLVCKVSLQQRSDSDDMTNVIKGYRARKTSNPSSSPSTAQQSSTPPWKRNSQSVATSNNDVPF